MAMKILSIMFLSACTASFAGAQKELQQDPSEPESPELLDINDLPDYWQDIARDARASYESTRQLETNAELAFPCNVLLETQAIIWGNPHMYVTNPVTGRPDKFRLTGDPNSDTWRVSPASPSHLWKPGVYTASPKSEPDMFRIIHVSVRSHNTPSGEEDHLYEMQIREWADDECPQYVDFYNLGEEDEPISDDPGHAGTGR